MPVEAIVPMTEPAEVPMITSASAGRQPVSDSRASRAPMSHDAPTTPPAPRTRPTRMRTTNLRYVRCDQVHGPAPTGARIAYLRGTLPTRRTMNQGFARLARQRARGSGGDGALVAAIVAGAALDVQGAPALDTPPPAHDGAGHGAVPDRPAA